DAGRFDVWVQKRDGSSVRMVAKGPGGYYSIAGWSPDDRRLLVSRGESNFNQDLYLIDVAGGKVSHLTPHREDTQYHSPNWSADGKSVYCVSTAGGRDLAGLAQIDLESRAVSWVDTPRHEVDSARPSPGGRWLAWLVNVEGQSELKLRDLKAGRTVTAK